MYYLQIRIFSPSPYSFICSGHTTLFGVLDVLRMHLKIYSYFYYSKRPSYYWRHYWPIGCDIRWICEPTSGTTTLSAPQPHPGYGTHHRHWSNSYGNCCRHVQKAWATTDTRYTQWVSHLFNSRLWINPLTRMYLRQSSKDWMHFTR